MSDDLRGKVLAVLPTNVQHLIDEIETAAGTPIIFAPNPYPISQTDPNPMGPACAVTHTNATIYLRDTENIDDHDILHELLHIHRFWVEMVPQVLPTGDDSDHLKITSSIENAVEHLIIVPKEADYGYEPYSHWNSMVRTNWRSYPWPDMVSSFARRKNMLLGRLTLKLVNDEATIELVENCLESEGLKEEADRFNAKIFSLLGNKPRAISCVLRFIKVPMNEVRLVYCDVKNRQQIIKEVPSH